MKKKAWIWTLMAVVLLAILFVPMPKSPCRDGGTREYAALTYKVVDWKRLTDDGVHEVTKVYWFPENFKSVDELWASEEQNVEHKFRAAVIEIKNDLAVVEPLEEEDERRSCDRITFSIGELGNCGAEVDTVVEVVYTGAVRETYPASVNAVRWAVSKDLRHLEYTGTWFEKDAVVEDYPGASQDVIITEIYTNCFFAQTVVPMPYQMKFNGTLSDDWCVGDQALVSYSNGRWDKESFRVEADLISVEVSDFELDPNACYKPVVYLYPEAETEVSVKLTLDGRLTCTYPAYQDGWKVIAAPDGTLTDAKGQTYNYLYWEGDSYARWDMSKGFCVKGEDTAAFLEDALSRLGLNRREANEFIVYWLPLMEGNPYNTISFQTDIYTDAAKLEITPAPDTLIRVFMAWQASDSFVELPVQELTAPERTGFAAIEWGGTQLKAK